MKRVILSILGLVLGLGLLLFGLSYPIRWGWLGHPHPFGDPVEAPLADGALEARAAAQTAARSANAVRGDKQILFGDLHVHTTLSIDAYAGSMPYLQGDGLHPISDACDFARFCSALDFWSLNDHAEGLTPDIWAKTRQAIRDCNAVADAENPDVVAFLGYEWTQAGSTPENHYGHKNVIFRDLADADVPTHPIAADNPSLGPRGFNTPMRLRAFSWLLDPGESQRFFDYNRYIGASEAVERCPDVPYDELPQDCIPFVATPAKLFSLLRQWGGETIVIPHGNAWGLYTPPGSTWDKQLVGEMHDPERQILVELFSGHGNSEEYRSWSEVELDADGVPSCPADRPDHVTGCQRAGEIIWERCMAAELGEEECARRRDEARDLFAKGGAINFATIPGATLEDWRDSEQCTDCYLPPFRHRPGGSTQYASAVRNFDDPEAPRRFEFGFIGSSDNHQARPGTGYKEYARTANTESNTGVSERVREIVVEEEEPLPRARPLPPPEERKLMGRLGITLLERSNSFFFTGGLVAAHSEGRTREAVWQALRRREVYATSGGRTLLWFDLLDDAGGRVPMGSSAERSTTPRFRVTAVGGFKQRPGCPQHSVDALGPERLEYVCKNECYHPSDERNPIERIEVVRIRPQVRPGEPVEGLIEDVWRAFACPEGAAGCTVEFDDPEFLGSGRDALYYVRAVEAPMEMINAGTLRVERDAGGDFVSMDACSRKPKDDDCLSLQYPMAWSSPIFVAHRTATQAIEIAPEKLRR